jgi:phage terminase large subunit-like protein
MPWPTHNPILTRDEDGTEHDKSTERIDGIVALIMAIGRALVAQEEPQAEYSMFFV